MCWSGEASVVLATAGVATTTYAACKGESKLLWMPLGYFTLMEILQAFTYSVIDDCGNPANQIATLLGYLHISFQPFFIHMACLYFIPQAVRHRLLPIIYFLCALNVVIMMIQLYPFEWAGQCQPPRPLCGEQLCSVSGNWHIAWEIPANGIGNTLAELQMPLLGPWLSYTLIGGLLAFLYGSWKMNLYLLVMGPMLASLLTDNPNEWPAVWCLLSIGFLIIVLKTRVRNYLYVDKWYFWQYPERLRKKPTI